MILWMLLLIPLATAIVIMLTKSRWARVIALIGSLAALGWACVVAFQFPHWQADEWMYWPPEDTFSVLPGMGVKVILGVDTVSLLLILLNVFLMPACVLGSWHAINERRQEFYAWLMVLGMCVMGVFLARDVIAFYTFFEDCVAHNPLVTVTHGDLRADNVMAARAPDDGSLQACVLIDMQCLKATCGEFDLAYLLSQSMRTTSVT